MKQHWLVRPGSIRLLWVVLLSILALTFLAGLWLDGNFAFNAWYGFASCIGMILIAKLLGRLLHRKDSYYDRD